MGKFVDKLKIFDVVSGELKLTYKGKTKMHSWFGCLLSFILGVLLVVASIFFGRDVFFKEEPIVRSNQEYAKNNKIYLKDSPLVLMPMNNLGAPALGTQLMEAVEIYADFLIFKSEGNNYGVTMYGALVEVCSEANMSPENYAFLTETENPNQHLCVNPYYRVVNGVKEKFDLYYENTFGYSNSAYVSANIKKCDEKLKPGCRKPLEDINYMFFSQVVFESYVDFNDFENPYKKMLTRSAIQVLTQIFNRTFVKMAINTVTTDGGPIFRQENTKIFSTAEQIYQTIQIYSDIDRLLLITHFEVSFVKNIYFRRYLKLQELLANLGGFMKIAFLVARLVGKLFGEFSFYNDMFVYKNLKNRLKPVQLNNSESNQSINIKEKPKVKLSLWQFISRSITGNKKSIEYYDRDDCFRYLDVGFISEELDKTRTIFSEEEHKLSRFIAK